MAEKFRLLGIRGNGREKTDDLNESLVFFCIRKEGPSWIKRLNLLLHLRIGFMEDSDLNSRLLKYIRQDQVWRVNKQRKLVKKAV